MNNQEWFKQAKYGMMVHWGLYSILGGEWKGRRTNNIGEWIQQHLRIPMAEYSQLAKAFNPIYFNAEEWVLFAKKCGMEYIVITSKHHDGFALFASKVDKYNVVDATPFKRDIIAELAEACYKHGIKLGLYYSQDIDWHEPDGGGGYDKAKLDPGCSNGWDFPDIAAKDYAKCFERKIKPQVEEILTNYGDLCLIWFDTPWTISKKQSIELRELVKKHQPNCLINSRIGNGVYDYVSLDDNEIPDSRPESFDPSDVLRHTGFRYSPTDLYETPATLNDTWGYKYFDHNWKTPEEILDIKNRLNAMGINYLLNVGPDALGRIPSISQDILLKVAEGGVRL
ncbi:MAG: alpha-L-fucosidase [Defluviitaleaceae bacterium]|nr:alpha-L-fucosidase [Defluviitaleaceae bacterium]